MRPDADEQELQQRVLLEQGVAVAVKMRRESQIMTRRRAKRQGPWRSATISDSASSEAGLAKTWAGRKNGHGLVGLCGRSPRGYFSSPSSFPYESALGESTMPLTRPRYDGYADWYDGWNQPHVERTAANVLDLLGPGEGLCLDLGCGCGHYFDAVASTGRTVIGLDRSADQLRIARGRCPRIVQGDGAALPFADGTFSAVLTMWISTDVDNFGAVLAEAVRVLTPGGELVFYGAHPCFNGPHVQWMEDGGVLVHPTYRQAGWHQESPWWGVNVRRRVGMRHHPLAELLSAFITTELTIEHVAEFGERSVPIILAIRARKRGRHE